MHGPARAAVSSAEPANATTLQIHFPRGETVAERGSRATSTSAGSALPDAMTSLAPGRSAPQ